MEPPCRINQYVDGAPPREYGFDHGGYGIRARDVRLERDRFDARGFSVARHSPRFTAVHIDDRNRGTFACERSDDRLTDALPCGSDDRYRACKSASSCHGFLVCRLRQWYEIGG